MYYYQLSSYLYGFGPLCFRFFPRFFSKSNVSNSSQRYFLPRRSEATSEWLGDVSSLFFYLQSVVKHPSLNVYFSTHCTKRFP